MTKKKRSALDEYLTQSKVERQQRRCSICRERPNDRPFDEDIRTWIEMYEAESGEDIGTWSTFTRWLSTHYQFERGTQTWARHASKCLGLQSPISYCG